MGSLRAEVWKMMFLGAVGVSIFLVVYGVASAPTRIASRLGLRGLKRQRALSAPGLWPQVEPLVRWLGVRVSGILPEERRNQFDEQITQAGDLLGLTVDEYLALCILSAIGCTIAGAGLAMITDNWTIPVLMFFVGGIIPYMQISGIAQDRLKNVSRGLPYVIDLMALAMGAGLDFPGAVRQCVEKSSNPNDPIVEEFTLILQTMNLGQTRKDCLTEFMRRCPVEAVKEFVGALVQAEERGNPVADVLQIQATSSRTRRSVRAEEMAAKAGVAMTGPLVLIFASVMILIMGPMSLKMSTM
ncbi:MAG TPA: type II secretion system F family protein [Polyangiaceae bacterium]|nr:type II secretion system F family protein [Polyangiaceae bacterium]